MAKSRTKKDINDFKKEMTTLIDKFGSKKRMTLLGKEAVSLIVIRTRVGRGFSTATKGGGDKATKLKPLSPNYIDYRKKNKAKLTGRAGTVKKSNLTFTGQLLNSIDVIKASKGKCFIGAKKERRKGETVKNSEIIGYQEKQGRVFLQLSTLDIKKLIRFMKNLVKLDTP